VRIAGVLGSQLLTVRTVALALALGLAALAVPATALGVDTRPRFVIGVLGDSYASGEGSPDVHGKHSALGDLVALECIQLPGQPKPCFTETWWSPDSWFPGRDAVFPQQDDAGWQDAARRCHRSTKATGPHAAMLIADRFPDVRVEVLDFACGGSTISSSCALLPGVNPISLTCLPLSTEPGGGPLLGWPGPEPPAGASNLPPQLTALRDYARDTNREIDAIVVNIGGNDGEFAELVTECLNIVNPIDDCTDNPTLTRIREKLIPDAGAPPAPDANEPMSERYRRLDAALRGPQFPQARPDELYLTALPNATRDAPPVDNPAGNPQDYCDGTQTADDIFNNATRSESQAIETVLAGLNGAMARAAARHGWVFLPQIFDAWRDHGICAEGASFIRTNDAGLRIQGDEGIPLPHISAGIAHPNEAGFANSAGIVADVVEEQVRMRFRAPTLGLDGIEANTAFRISWSDPSPNHLAETKWELELASPGSVQTFSSSGPGELDGFSAGSANSFGWRVARQGEFNVRVRGCRTTLTGSYCGPFSNAIAVATRVPGTPLDLRRTSLLAIDSLLANPIRLAWSPGPNSTASTRYEVHFGRFGGGCTSTTISSCTILGSGGVVNTTSTSARISLPESGEWAFRIRACSTAGCSPFSGFLTATVSSGATPKSPVGTFVLRAPSRARAGRRARVDVAWTTPRSWTALDRIDIRLRAGARRLGTIRFSQDDGVLWVIHGKRRSFGHPDTEGRLDAGAFAVDLAHSSLVRFKEPSRRVSLRLAIVPSRSLRGRTITLAISARDDRGRRQAERLAGVVRIG